MEQEIMQFDYDQNKIAFELQSKSLKYASEIQYKYRLNGIDNKWQYNDYLDNKIEYKTLPVGEYKFEYSTICRGAQSNSKSFSFEIKAPYWKTKWFLGLSVLALISIVLFISMLINKGQKKKAKLKYELSNSQLATLKSQMNPHFIFNSLNSIQDLVLRQEGEKAYDYINKVAFLVRKVLLFSTADYVEIEEEIKMLNIYLDLEKLRFKEDFSFEVIYNERDSLEIPPMVIQPFVENALKHGLFHKKGKKKLIVSFENLTTCLVCTIEDNGIGRLKSKEINKRKWEKHDSFSINAIKERFEILKKVHGNELGFQFEDLYSEKEPVGTKVTIKIPYKRRY
jgi:LytS/YehU family sensor histidine kinase